MRCECSDVEIVVIEEGMIPFKASTIGVQTMCFRCGAINRLIEHPEIGFHRIQAQWLEEMRRGRIYFIETQIPVIQPRSIIHGTYS